MTELSRHDRPDRARDRLGEEEEALGRAQAAVACGRHEAAARLLAAPLGSRDPRIEIEAKLQLALVRHFDGDSQSAAEILSEVRKAVGDRCAADREGEMEDAAGEANDRVEKPHLELMLGLARTLSSVGLLEDARSAYAELLRDRCVDAARTEETRHVAALAEYRLAELRVEEEPWEAYRRWRRALEMRVERVSPYAALQIATKIGSPHLVPARVELLFHQAMGSSDPQLFSESALGLARHFKQHHQFDESRRYFQTVLDHGDQGAVRDEAAGELASLDKCERMVANREKLRRPQQLVAKVRSMSLRPERGGEDKRVIIVGAGKGGDCLLDSLDRTQYKVCGFIDDSAKDVHGHRILGRIDDLEEVIRAYSPDEVLLAIPTLAGVKRREVVRACQATSTLLLHLPAMHDLGIGWTRTENRLRLRAQLRSVKVAEMIGEDRVVLDPLSTRWLQDGTAVVVGAGAFGSEICRRLADGGIGRLVVVDRNESAIRKVKRELRDTRKFWAFESRVGDAANRRFLAKVFQGCETKAVFNASGDFSMQALDPKDLVRDPDRWKTVVGNEVRVADAAARAAVDAEVPWMVHVSSKRAGCPRDPFGAMKAVCEEVVLRHANLNRRPEKVLAVVRVGPLPDSRNGLLTGMEEQIQAGAPVEIPGPGATVRFISTARWAELVLHAARLSANGELLELRGGNEIAIKKIAEYALRLHGYDPDDVGIDEARDESWDEPPPSKGGDGKGEPELGIHRLDRAEAGGPTLEAAVELCAMRLEECIGGRAAVNPVIRDQIAGFAGVSESIHV
jgi:FlaA1/EpsC-like NDP-sugar epimerase